MPISIDEYNTLNNKYICMILGVDSFTHKPEMSYSDNRSNDITVTDITSSPFGKTKYRDRTFHREFFEFEKDGRKYHFCIDPVVKTERFGEFMCSGIETTLDIKAMESEIKRILLR